MLDWKTAALMFSWLMLVGLVKGIPRVQEVLVNCIPRVEEDKGVSLSSCGLAPDFCLACCILLGFSRRWFEYFIGTSLTVLSGH